MRIDRTTAPGCGMLNHIVTRDGQRFCVIVEKDGRRRLLTYDDGDDPDVPATSIVLDGDEADQVAELLHSRPIAERVVRLERCVNELIHKARAS